MANSLAICIQICLELAFEDTVDSQVNDFEWQLYSYCYFYEEMRFIWIWIISDECGGVIDQGLIRTEMIYVREGESWNIFVQADNRTEKRNLTTIF